MQALTPAPKYRVSVSSYFEAALFILDLKSLALFTRFTIVVLSNTKYLVGYRECPQLSQYIEKRFSSRSELTTLVVSNAKCPVGYKECPQLSHRQRGSLREMSLQPLYYPMQKVRLGTQSAHSCHIDKEALYEK